MRTERAPRLGPASVALALACACGSPPPPPSKPPARAASSVGRYLPLKPDHVYVYDTELEGTGERGVLMLRVEVGSSGVVELGVGGRKQRLRFHEDAIENVTGGYLLKAPLVVGATWRGMSGTVRVVAVGKRVKVPAGDLTDCVETVETESSSGAVRSVTTVFCAGVGIASLEVEASAGGEYARERAVLRSFGPKVDLLTAPPP
ncbi:MAG: hypothetical protein IT376_00900 [Polyangiaceae bacterium]|nr:hypothetical protein [Polyangiaceae bacterium]